MANEARPCKAGSDLEPAISKHDLGEPGSGALFLSRGGEEREGDGEGECGLGVSCYEAGRCNVFVCKCFSEGRGLRGVEYSL